ncbi:MAG: S8 family serine peptidase [Flavitalea sp.]
MDRNVTSPKQEDPRQTPRREWAKYFPIDREYDRVREFKSVPNQLVVFVGKVSNERLDAWVDRLKKRVQEISPDAQEIKALSICGRCNESLVLLGGVGMEAFVKTEAAAKGSGSRPAPGATGEDDGIYYSANYVVDVPPKVEDETTTKNNNDTNSKGEPKPENMVNVAVLDTGLAPNEVDQYLITNSDPCIPGANKGWNFVRPGQPYTDDHPEFHGSTVTRLMLDRCMRFSDNIRIIPAKIHDQDGKCDLYSMLCALAYSANMGAHIINASFGYYAPWKYGEGFCVALFREFIKEILTKQNILLIAAAGNKPKVGEIEVMYENPADVPADPCNLDDIHFFPASFANDPELWNVISVTTLETDMSEVVSTQNYSIRVVDIGVPADDKGNGFINPRVPGSFVKGSSFATPIVTGIIAGNYPKLKGITDKEKLIERLIKLGLMRRKNSTADIRYAIAAKRKRTLLEIILSWFFG